MTRHRSIARGSVVAASLALGAAPLPASAQALLPGTAEPGAGMIVALVLGLLAAFGVVVRVYHRKRQREQRAIELQVKLSDALFLEPALSAFAITPSVHAPAWPGAPLSVDIAGVVPTGQHRDAALQLVRRETAGVAEDLHVESRIVVDSRRFMRAA